MRITILIISILLSTSLLGQYHVTISGKVIDEQLNIGVFKPKIQLRTTKGEEFITYGDTFGNFKLSFNTDYDSLVSIIIISAENQFTSRNQLFLKLNSDTIIHELYYLKTGAVCNDSWLPSPLFFEPNTIITKDSLMLKEFLSNDSNEVIEFGFSKSRLSIYCVQGFFEKDGIALERANYIKSLITNNYTFKNKIEIEIIIIGTEDYFYCTHCNSCIDYYKNGQGIELTREFVSKYPQLDQLRHLVELKWE